MTRTVSLMTCLFLPVVLHAAGPADNKPFLKLSPSDFGLGGQGKDGSAQDPREPRPIVFRSARQLADFLGQETPPAAIEFDWSRRRLVFFRWTDIAPDNHFQAEVLDEVICFIHVLGQGGGKCGCGLSRGQAHLYSIPVNSRWTHFTRFPGSKWSEGGDKRGEAKPSKGP